MVHCSQQRFIILINTLPVSSLTSLTTAITTPRMAHFSVAAGLHADPAGDGMLTRGPGTWWLSHSQSSEMITSPGHWQMEPRLFCLGADGLTLLLKCYNMTTIKSWHHFLWNIRQCKECTEVTSNISWSSSHYRASCSIPDPDTDTVVVTGGLFISTTVSRYGRKGWIEDFSTGLTTGRFWHGCASYISKDHERV